MTTINQDFKATLDENAALRHERDKYRDEAHLLTRERDQAVKELAEARGALEEAQAMQPRAVAIMEREGFKFETRLDLSEGFEKLAFTFYSMLCEVEQAARRALSQEVQT